MAFLKSLSKCRHPLPLRELAVSTWSSSSRYDDVDDDDDNDANGDDEDEEEEGSSGSGGSSIRGGCARALVRLVQCPSLSSLRHLTILDDGSSSTTSTTTSVIDDHHSLVVALKKAQPNLITITIQDDYAPLPWTKTSSSSSR